MSTHSPAKIDPNGATASIIDFALNLDWATLPAEVQHEAKRHFFDTIGAQIAGASGEIACQAEAVLAAVRAAGSIPVPGRKRRADLLDAAYLGGTAGHGIELDDGYRQGALHPGAVIVSAILPLAYQMASPGTKVLEAMVAGYETMLGIARTVYPEIRRKGFHPTAVVGVFGSTAAAAKLLGLNREQFSNALGIAASSAAGIHAYVNGGADIKRLHAGHAAREGVQAALLAREGVAGPPGVVEGHYGFFEVFAFGKEPPARPFSMPPKSEYLIPQCYVKPYACCRHIQPAAEALMALVKEHAVDAASIREIKVETYTLASEHAHVGWGDFASSQLSFPFSMAVAARYGRIGLEHFSAEIRGSAEITALCHKVEVRATADMDARYPNLRPARVNLVTDEGSFVREVDEAIGAPELPLDDDGLSAKFIELVGSVVGNNKATESLERLWHVDELASVAGLLDDLAG